MAEISQRQEAMNRLLNDAASGIYLEVSDMNLCLPPPLGCGGTIQPFETDEQARQFGVSGLCVACQNGYDYGDEETGGE